MDIISQAKRSEIMALIKGKDTKPEMAVRKLVFSMGYRYRLHGKGLPGRPDLVFARRRQVVFVHGCFWHMHARCGRFRIPATRSDFWEEKLKKNRERDSSQRKKLHRLGWKVLVVWECEIKGVEKLRQRLHRFLDG